MRLLLVEDDPALSARLRQTLAAAGYAVDHAADGRQAWYQGGVQDYDAIVLDLGLPLLDGLSVLKRWRSEGMRAPVLLLTVRRSAGQELEWQLDCTAPDATFAGTPDDLQQAIGNLLDNAGKWAAKTVRTRLLCRDHEICLIIEDDGPGLSSSQQEQALERGVRLDERQPGNGLGLDIVRDLMQIHGGRIELQRSELGGLAASLIWSATACVRP